MTKQIIIWIERKDQRQSTKSVMMSNITKDIGLCNASYVQCNDLFVIMLYMLHDKAIADRRLHLCIWAIAPNDG